MPVAAAAAVAVNNAAMPEKRWIKNVFINRINTREDGYSNPLFSTLYRVAKGMASFHPSVFGGRRGWAPGSS